MPDLKAELLDRLRPYGQEQVLSFWEKLSAEERNAFAEQIRHVDFQTLSRAVKSQDTSGHEGAGLEPAPFVALPTDAASRDRWEQARCAGHEALAAGRVAAMVVAGGQGTRLGFAGPKGAFPIGPITQRTLFQIHCEKVLAASRRYGRTIPLLVMTGPSNDAETRFFLKEHNFFGLPLGAVRIFRQGELPAVDDAGKVILDAPGHVFVCPNGHGGSLKALWDSGTIEWLESQGIDIISYFQVDNPLVRAVDPAFIGFHILSDAEMSLKLVKRRDAEEKLGIWLNVGGKKLVIEYSDMPVHEMRARDSGGGLKYPGGSIAIHCFSTEFVRRLSAEGFALPFHRARKKVPYVDASGHLVEPGAPNATKFEMFVFDALFFTDRATAVETDRQEEFSPVKNADGSDSPETARRDMSRLYARWLKSIGVTVATDDAGYPAYPIEISPLVGEDDAALEMNYHWPKEVTGPLVAAW